MKRHFLLVTVISGLAVLLYLGASSWIDRIGYPLDDAWIHQTYARNLVFLGEWAYIPGEVSAGSTAPLWTLILAAGYWLTISPEIWTYLWGFISLAGLAFAGSRLAYTISDGNNKIALVSGIFLASEWHFIWGANSGMETLLFTTVIVVIFYFLYQRRYQPLFLGLLIGIAVWLRPDGITLIGPVGLYFVLSKYDLKTKLKQVVSMFAGVIIFVGVYMVLNYVNSGTIWPNTFYAKQVEYAALQSIPLVKRYFSLFTLPMIGGGALLIPGFVYFIYLILRTKYLQRILMIVWLFGYIGMYAWRLPVTYQHGRYLIPAMPIYFIASIIGCYLIWEKINQPGKLRWIILRTWLFSFAVIWLAFVFLGANTYANDVAIINTEMVATSKWIAENTQEDAIIAAHDIGALGYFGHRRIIDLAGLITPEVIPILREEAALIDYMNRENVNYLMTFPGWYSELPRHGLLIYQSNATFSPRAGGENMAVYIWRQE